MTFLTVESRRKIKEFILKPKILEFVKWVAIDIYRVIKHGRKFQEYGLTLYCGRQGAGKTIGMVEYLERMRVRYPKALIITNFYYKYQSMPMNGWRDLLEVRNGEDGVIFAIDEVHLEYNSADWANFDSNLLSEISQQRKQRIKIIASSQVFTRVVKQIREQAFDVVEARTIAGRWTFQRCFDAEDYLAVVENPDKKVKLSRKWRRNFIMTDNLRELYDSYKKVESMRKRESIPRLQR